MNSFLFPLISVLFIIGTVAITQQLMHNYFSFKNLLPIFISALYNYQDIYSFHSCSESDNFCVFCPHWLNKYFVLSTFYTFYLHTIINKEGFLLMQKQQIPLKNSLILLLAAIIWGIAFVAQSVGMDYVGGFTFNAVRSLIGSAVLVPLILVLGQKNSGSVSSHSTTSGQQSRKDLIIGGISCGICLCLASNFQQFGIKYTTVGKAGFITACYIVIVPVIGLFLGKKCSKFIWAAVVMSLVGLYLLCITDGFSVGKGGTACTGLCIPVLCAHPGYRPLLSESRWSKTFLHPVPDLWNPFRYPCTAVRTSGTFFHSGSMAANPLCRCHVLRCRLHPSDYRSEEYEPDCRIPDPQSGILYLCPRRMGSSRPAVKC